MKKLTTILLLFFVILSTNSLKAQSNKNGELIKAFLDTIQANSYMSANINWDSIRPIFINKNKHIENLKDLEPSFKQFIKVLKDGHSKLHYEESNSTGESDENQLERLLKMTDKEAGLPPKKFESYLIKDKYAYINIPAVTLENRKYVDTIGVQLKNLDQQNPKAWIIDLTENTGGNIIPMIWQFASFVDVKNTYSYVNKDGKETKQKTKFKNITDKDELKGLKLFNLDYKSVKPVKIKNNKVPIIILTSQVTASSGEFFAAHFKGQKNVKLIGQKTAGLTSANSPFNIGENYVLILTTDILKDRNNKIYRILEGIEPDISFSLPFPQNSNKSISFDLLKEIVKNNKNNYIEKAIQIIEENK